MKLGSVKNIEKKYFDEENYVKKHNLNCCKILKK